MIATLRAGGFRRGVLCLSFAWLLSCAVPGAPRREQASAPQAVFLGEREGELRFELRFNGAELLYLQHSSDDGASWSEPAALRASPELAEISMPWPSSPARLRLSSAGLPRTELRLEAELDAGPVSAPRVHALGGCVRVDAPDDAAAVLQLFRRDLRQRGSEPQLLASAWWSEEPFVDCGLRAPAVFAYSVANTTALRMSPVDEGAAVTARTCTECAGSARKREGNSQATGDAVLLFHRPGARGAEAYAVISVLGVDDASR
ncbi:MAG: hypothetical protein RBU37_16710 [Myxococcota bacterium]|nr:hypothetical protein [Myxococcota bacterium]